YNYRIGRGTNAKFQLFTGSDLYYSNINYSGDFQGGLSGGGERLDDNYHSFGVLHRLGIHFYPISSVRITLITSYRLGFTWHKGINDTDFQRFTESSKTIPEVKIGFLF
ncbi:MAG: hypothetical protein JKY09_06180, partial [Crocinitomicaceae bacterium]|nr:hypothetical protein [Crocinitomicaceae bacterium]